MDINRTIESRKAQIHEHQLVEIVNQHSNHVSLDEIKNAQFLESYVPFEDDLIKKTVDFKVNGYRATAKGRKIGVIYSEEKQAIEFYKI